MCVKAERTKEKEKMTQLERFVTECGEKADELAKSRSNGRLASAVWWRNGKIVQCSSISREKSGFSLAREREYEASNRVVRGSRQVSMYELWKRKQIHEDARKMHRTETPVKKFGKMEKTPFGGHDLVRRKDRKRRGIEMVQKMLGIREAEIGTKASELL